MKKKKCLCNTVLLLYLLYFRFSYIIFNQEFTTIIVTINLPLLCVVMSQNNFAKLIQIRVSTQVKTLSWIVASILSYSNAM